MRKIERQESETQRKGCDGESRGWSDEILALKTKEDREPKNVSSLEKLERARK